MLISLLPFSAQAGTGGGEYAPMLSAGVNFYSGDTGKSLTGALGYLLSLKAEKRKNFLRPFAAAEFEYSSGTASVGAASPSFTLMGGGFRGGVDMFVFTTGRFQVFLGGAGVLSWHMLKMPSPPAGTEPNTQGISYGYEAGAGVEMRLGSAEGNAIRIETTYSSISSNLAEISGFQLTGFKFLIGIVY